MAVDSRLGAWWMCKVVLGQAVRASLCDHGALLSRRVTKAEIVACGAVGTEAIRRLEVVDFVAVLAYDAAGGSVYDMIGGNSGV
jgi:tartrate dehydratase beta subunit/fumarate hydratase class I family protein